MSINGQSGARLLGQPQQMNIRVVEVTPVASVDAVPWSPMPDKTGHIAIGLPADGRLLLIPCDAVYLRRVAAQFERVAGIIENTSTPEGQPNGK